MELNETVASLQDEVKLLKGEIKAVLKEIRTAVLSENNPFAIGLDSPALRGPRPDSAAGQQEAPAAPPPPAPTSQPAAWPVPPPPQAMAPQMSPMPSALPAGPMAPIVISAGGPSSAPTPQPAAPAEPPATAPAELSPSPGAARQGALKEPAAAATSGPVSPAAEQEPIPLRPQAQQEPAKPPAQRWSLLTIAGLMAWAEDAVAAMGPRRFRIILELACFAELLPPDMRDVLGRIAQQAPQSVEDKPMNVIECVVSLHQLEAILQGETPTKLPLRRGTA